jgi:hypothetical protein
MEKFVESRPLGGTPGLGRGHALAVLLACLLLGACAMMQPDVNKTITTDDKGRKVSNYRICEQQGFLWMAKIVCRTESVVHNYCYRSLGRVDCHEQPVEGRTAMKAHL